MNTITYSVGVNIRFRIESNLISDIGVLDRRRKRVDDAEEETGWILVKKVVTLSGVPGQ